MGRLLSSIFRFAAICLLVCIGFEIADETDCDAVIVAPEQASMQAHVPAGDGCQAVCLPDCFCCCPAINGPTSISLSPIRLQVTREEVLPGSQPEGVTTPIFHPPVSRA